MQKALGAALGCLCGAVPNTANTSRAGAAACPGPSASHLHSQPVAKPAAFTNFPLQRAASIPPTGTVLGGSLAKYRLSVILQSLKTAFLRWLLPSFLPCESVTQRASSEVLLRSLLAAHLSLACQSQPRWSQPAANALFTSSLSP